MGKEMGPRRSNGTGSLVQRPVGSDNRMFRYVNGVDPLNDHDPTSSCHDYSEDQNPDSSAGRSHAQDDSPKELQRTI